MTRSTKALSFIAIFALGAWAARTLSTAPATPAAQVSADAEESAPSLARASAPTSRPSSNEITSRKAVAQPPSTCSADCASSESALEGRSDRVLETKLDRARRALPTVAQVQSSARRGDDVHHTPPAILESGRAIGEAMADADRDPASRAKTMDFLLACAEDREVLPSVRAHCLAAAQRSSRKWSRLVPFSQLRVSSEIRVLAARIPIPQD